MRANHTKETNEAYLERFKKDFEGCINPSIKDPVTRIYDASDRYMMLPYRPETKGSPSIPES